MTRRLSVIILILVVASIYARTLGNDFVYDDNYIVKNPLVLDGVTIKDAVWPFTTSPEGNWIPLTWISHLLAVSAFGINPRWHHLVQILLHAANVSLLFLLLRGMTGAGGRSFLVALLFAVHPLHVESVAWVAERKDLLSTFFGLLSLHAYLGYVRRGGSGRYLAVLALFAAGLMSKPMLVTLPVLLLLLDWWPLNRVAGLDSTKNAPTSPGADPHPSWPVWKLAVEKVPLLLLAVAAGVMVVATQEQSGLIGDLARFPLWVRLSNALISLVVYLGKLAVPIGLAVFYPHPGHAVSQAWSVAAGIALAAVTVTFLSRRWRQPYLLWGWLWYIVTIVPVIGIVQVGDQARADRYAYLTFIGLYVLVVWAVADFSNGRPAVRRALGAAAATMVAVFAFLTVRQTGFWKDNEHLFGHAVAVTKGNWVANHNLGIALAGKGRLEEAVGHFGEAVLLQPDNPKYLYHYGRVLALLGRYTEAEEQYRRALPLSHLRADIHRDLGAVLKAQERFQEAEAELREAVRLNPSDNRAWQHLGDAVAGKGNPASAREAYERALASNPGDWRAHHGLAGLLVSAGDRAGAERHFREALLLNPEYVDAGYELALLLDSQGRYAEAVNLYLQVLRIRPDLVQARNNLGVDLEEMGRFREAEEQYREALRLSPGRVNSIYNLGLLLTRQGRGKEAEELFRRSLAVQPESADLHHGLGRTLTWLGDRSGAVREFEKALALHPGFTQARDDLATIQRGDSP